MNDFDIFGWWMGMAGFLFLVGAFFDAAATAIRAEGGGPLTRLFVDLSWRALLGMRRFWSLSHRSLSYAATGMLLALLVIWEVLVWLGWSLIFSADPHCVVSSADGKPADLLERIYFAGSTIITLGLGDFRPNGHLWELLTVVAGASGYFMAALSVSYILPVFQAALKKREVAAHIGALGSTPEQLALNFFKEPEVGRQLESLTGDILKVSESHQAYPVLHFFHSSSSHAAFSVKLGVLDEALTMLTAGVKKKDEVRDATFLPLRRAISLFLNTIKEVHMKPADESPPPRSLSFLEEHGIEATEEVYLREVESLSPRRRALLGLVQSHGWSWEQVSRQDAAADAVEV